MRRRHCKMLGLCLGIESLRVVLVDSLDLGHDVHTVHSRLHLSPCARIAGLAGVARVGNLRRFVRDRCAGQSYDARVPSLLRVVDLAAEIPPRSEFTERSRNRVRVLLVSALAVAGPEL